MKLTVAILLASSFFISCKGDLPDLPSLLFETEHFRYYYQEGNTPCQDLLDRLEAHRAAISDYLGTDLLGTRKSVYYNFVSQDGCIEYCGNASGCFDSGSVISCETDVYGDGLVRAYLVDVGSPPEFFVAGAANFLASGFVVPEMEIPQGVSLVSMVTDEDFSKTPLWVGDIYRNDLAGSFSKYLVDTSGAGVYLELYSKLRRGMSVDEIDETFEEVTGGPFQEIHFSWQGTLPQDAYFHHLFLLECSGTPNVIDADEETSISGDLDCTGRNLVVRMQSGDLEIEDVSSSELFFWPCTSPGNEPHPLWILESGKNWLRLPAGDYFFALDADTYPESYDIRLQGRDGIIGDRVEQANLQHVEVPSQVLVLMNSASLEDDYTHSMFEEGRDAVIRFVVDEPGSLSANSYSDLSLVSLCPDDAFEEDERCFVLSRDGQRLGQKALEAGVNYRLFIESTPGGEQLTSIDLQFD